MTARRCIGDLAARLPKTQTALEYAERRHAGQRRADGAPFIEHPLEVATLLYDAGAPDHVIAAGALHDTIEKTGASAADLRSRFGSTIAALVLAVSEDPGITEYQARKEALRNQIAAAGHDALMVLAADKISKARELRHEPTRATHATARPQPSPSQRDRLAHHQRCLELLENLDPESPLVDQLRAELERTAAGIDGSPVLTAAR